MKLKLQHSILIPLFLLSGAEPAFACQVLEKLQPYDTKEVSAAEIRKCIELGGDSYYQFRPESGKDIIENTGTGSTLDLNQCGVDGVCLNANAERTEDFVAGAGPDENPNLNLPPIPWKDMKNPQIPCGAVGGLAEIALQAIWGNVRIQLPSGASNLINSSLTNLVGNLFNKSDCQDGTFWGLLNNVISVILPNLGFNGSGFVFDMDNSTFIAPVNTYIAVPIQGEFIVDTSAGGASFTLPAGGSFNDISGKQVNLSAGSTVQFDPSGAVTTSTGQSYKIEPQAIVNLNPKGIVKIPEGAVVPVPPNTTVFPMAPLNKQPEWAGS